MNRNTVYALLASIMVLAAIANADARLLWLEESYDFGTFREVGGPREGYVRFVNLGPDTTAITRVRPSCGCTSERHTENLIAPGDTATVWFTYNPKGRPGRFAKTVKIYIGASGDVKHVPITGTVVGEPSSLAPEYPVTAIGGIRLSDTIVDFGTINYGHLKHLFLKGYNQNIDTIYPRAEAKLKNGPIDAVVSSDTVAPGDFFTISFYFNARQNAKMGDENYDVALCDKNDTFRSTRLTIKARVLPESATLTASQLAEAPMLSVESDVVEAEVKKDKARFKIEVTNKGKSQLNILRAYSKAANIKINKLPSRLKPDAKGVIEGEIDLKDIEAPAFAYIVEIVGNDPRMPVKEVRVAGQICK